jgi:hypothetical protein
VRAVRDLSRNGERLLQRQGPTAEALGQRGTVDQLHDERRSAGGVLEAVDLRDVRRVERGEPLRLALKAADALRVAVAPIIQATTVPSPVAYQNRRTP